MTSAAELVASAAAMLDEESHRYVERFTACPNGCVWDYRPGTTDLVQTAGPTDCQECSWGSAEDEEAEHLNPFIDELRQLAERLAAAEKDLADLDVEGWPGHMTCSEAETVGSALGIINPDRGVDLIAAHAEEDSDEDTEHHAVPETPPLPAV